MASATSPRTTTPTEAIRSSPRRHGLDGRHGRRVVRVLPLRHRGDAGLQQDHVPAVGRPADPDHRRIRHLRRRLRRPPARRHRLRPLRRQVRPQEAPPGRDHPRRRRHLPDGLPAHVRPGRLTALRRCWSLLRFAQGFAVGGEWGGAVLLVAEHSPDKSRGFWASFPQAAVPIGNLLATIVLLVLSRTLTEEQFLAWGWRDRRSGCRS